jgi:hypothetical protein
MRIQLDVKPTEVGSDAVISIQSDVPFGPRRGTEMSYRRGMRTLAEALRAEVPVLEVQHD